MRRNMVSSLFEHETIATTIQKAKEVKPFAEKLITLAKKGTLPARRRAISMLGNRNIVENEDGKTVKKGSVVGKLFSEIGPRYLDRPGGYTRIIRRSLRRLGDNGELVLLQLIGSDEGPKKKAKTHSKRRSASKPKKKAPEVATAGAIEPEEFAEVQEAVEIEQAAESEDTAPVKQAEETPEVQGPEQAEAESVGDKTDEAPADADEDAEKE